jgi:hypothetical protein
MNRKGNVQQCKSNAKAIHPAISPIVEQSQAMVAKKEILSWARGIKARINSYSLTDVLVCPNLRRRRSGCPQELDQYVLMDSEPNRCERPKSLDLSENT